MKIEITRHAKERMRQYDIQEELVNSTLENPDSILGSYENRKIYQKKLNGYVIRVVVEEYKGIKVVLTVYKARSGRYEIQV
ncbi:MAG TPA: DUF4258 domain-containing protein [archaeon]|nr:DUF4258 domain-containing protein [archaeon]